MTGSWITTISSSRYLLLLLSLKVTNTDKIVQVTSCKHIQQQIVSTVKQLSFRHLISLDDDSNKLWSSSKIIHIVVETRILNWVTRIINHQTIFCALRNFSRECEVCREWWRNMTETSTTMQTRKLHHLNWIWILYKHQYSGQFVQKLLTKYFCYGKYFPGSQWQISHYRMAPLQRCTLKWNKSWYFIITGNTFIN